MKKLILLTLLVSLSLYLNAQSTYTFNGGNGNWNANGNWGCVGACPGNNVPPNPLPSGSTIIINGNVTSNIPDPLTINSGATLSITSNFTIPSGTDINNSGTMVVAMGVTLTNNGIISNSGMLTNNGTITNGSGGMITNNNGATFTNNNIINNNSGATITNNVGGVLANDGTSTFNNSGTFTNNGTGALPITLSEFDPVIVGNTVVIKWITASEKNNAYMDVERSKDGINFVRILREKGHGTTSEPKYYSRTDSFPMPGLNYYRLKQVDEDGNFEYHIIKAVDFKGKTADAGIRIFPTEVKDQLTIALDAPTTQEATLLVVDMTGRVMQRQRLGIGTLQEDLQVRDLPQGQYFISLQTEEGLKTARFVKVR